MPLRDSDRRCLEWERVGDVMVVRLTCPRIMAHDLVDTLAAQLAAFAERADCRKIVLDCGKVRLMTAAMVRKLVALHTRATEIGSRVVLCNVDAFLRAIFQVCKLPQELRVYPDEQEALQSLA